MNFCMNTCLGVWNTSFCVDYLFGMPVCLVVVLNGGKNCIEKMLGFRGDVVRFFLKTHVLFWLLLIQIE